MDVVFVSLPESSDGTLRYQLPDNLGPMRIDGLTVFVDAGAGVGNRVLVVSIEGQDNIERMAVASARNQTLGENITYTLGAGAMDVVALSSYVSMGPAGWICQPGDTLVIENTGHLSGDLIQRGRLTYSLA